MMNTCAVMITCLHTHTHTQQEAASWVKTIEEQIKKIISESVSHKRVNSCNDLAKKDVISVEGNQFCADCNAPSKWVYNVTSS